MRAAACIMLLSAAPAWALSVGETYQQVIAEKGNPKSSIVAGTMRMLNYPGMMVKFKDDVVVSITATEYKAPPTPVPTAAPSPSPTPVLPTNGTQAQVAQIYALADQVNSAVKAILTIINAPVTHVPKQAGMKIQSFGPLWFKPGATRPDFNNPDIAKTQELPYAKYAYVSSDLNPDEAFIGSELEFNTMTKFFYIDRTVPKKKLTPAEMGEIDRLYRIIGQCEPQLIKLGYKGQMP
jgi:hypothetical protein